MLEFLYCIKTGSKNFHATIDIRSPIFFITAHVDLPIIVLQTT